MVPRKILNLFSRESRLNIEIRGKQTELVSRGVGGGGGGGQSLSDSLYIATKT